MRRSVADLGDLVHLKARGPGQVKVIVSFSAFIYLPEPTVIDQAKSR